MNTMRGFIRGLDTSWLLGNSNRYWRNAFRKPTNKILYFFIVLLAGCIALVFAVEASIIKGGVSQNAADHGFTYPSVSQQIVPDPVAPAADTQYIAAPPSGQASDNSSSLSSNVSAGNMSLNINGKQIDVPANGSVSQTVTSPNGVQSTVNASSQSSYVGNQTNQSVSFTSSQSTSTSSSTALGGQTITQIGGQ